MSRSDKGVQHDVSIPELHLERLERALSHHASEATCLRAWSQYIRVRDGSCCVICNGKNRLAAHHICRKSFLPEARFMTGNGITLCRPCHDDAHAGYNGRPDLSQPMDAQGGEKIEILSDLLIHLADAAKRSSAPSRHYFLSDEVLSKFKLFQGFEWNAPFPGSPIEQAAMVWRASSPTIIEAILRANFL